jgi:S1-C subfamily serine protease
MSSSDHQAPQGQMRKKSLLWALAGVLLGLLAFWLWHNNIAASPSLPAAQTASQPAPSVGEPAPPESLALNNDDLLLVQRARNSALEEEIQRLEQALRDDPCVALELLRRQNPSLQPLPPGALPAPGQSQPAEPTQGESNNLSGQPAGSENLPPINQPPAPANVGQLLEQATVFILALDSDSQVRMGSGFFVAPGIIISNRHVVGSEHSRIMAGNPAMGGMRPGQVIAVSSQEKRDYALVRLAGTEAMPFLRIGEGAKRTERISAWGFPAFITTADPKLQALIEGDVSAAPEVVYSEGVVSVVLDGQPPIIVHTAALSQGNSGGPLVSEQGVAAGINTMIKLAAESYNQSSLALPGEDMAAFMRENGITPTQAE